MIGLCSAMMQSILTLTKKATQAVRVAVPEFDEHNASGMLGVAHIFRIWYRPTLLSCRMHTHA